MSTTEITTRTLLERPKRADARRNYEKVLTAAREAFAEGGESTALEEIARRAGVGIGTLYRNFANRDALIEAVFLDSIETSRARAEALLDSDLSRRRSRRGSSASSGYMATKQAPSPRELSTTSTRQRAVQVCRTSLWAAVSRCSPCAEAGVVRPT
jgi:AcrR family transcriptional regulator